MNVLAVPVGDRADPRLVFLHRAHSRLILVENGWMSLDEAYRGLIECVPCECNPSRRRTA
jgi:hypothetical protein